jgi:hypothetical protein
MTGGGNDTDDEPTHSAAEPSTVNRRGRRQRRRHRLVSAAVPVVLSVFAVSITFAITSAMDPRYGHDVTLTAKHDGRHDPYVNQAQLFQNLKARIEADRQLSAEVLVAINTRFNTTIELSIEAPSQERASDRAEALIDMALTDRREAAVEVDKQRVESLTAELETAERELEGALDVLSKIPADADPSEAQRNVVARTTARNALVGPTKLAEADLGGRIVGVDVAQSVATGRVSPEPLRDAALAGAVAALVGLILVATWRHD